MTITQTQRDEVYETLPPHKKALYAGEETGNALWTIFNEYHLPEELYYEYAMAFGDVVLDLMLETELPQALAAMGLSQKMAGLVAQDLLQLIHSGAPTGSVPAAPQQATPLVAQQPAPLAPQTAEPADAAAHWAAILAKKDREHRAAVPIPRVNEEVPQPTQPAPPPQWRTTTPPAREQGAVSEATPATEVPRYVKDDPYREPLK